MLQVRGEVCATSEGDVCATSEGGGCATSEGEGVLHSFLTHLFTAILIPFPPLLCSGPLQRRIVT